jgi:hypothetical protein
LIRFGITLHGAKHRVGHVEFTGIELGVAVLLIPEQRSLIFDCGHFWLFIATLADYLLKLGRHHFLHPINKTGAGDDIFKHLEYLVLKFALSERGVLASDVEHFLTHLTALLVIVLSPHLSGSFRSLLRFIPEQL